MCKALFVYTKDSTALAGCGNWTGGVAAEETVTEAGDDGVAELAEGTGDKGEEGTKAAPIWAEELEGVGYCVGAVVEALGGGEGGGDEDDAFEGVGRG
jgi:hypothetical protein